MKVVHSWLKEYVGDTIPSAAALEELLTFYAFEVEGVEERDGESVIDVKILPDRGSDCLSHRGIAREIATITDVLLVHDPLREPVMLAPTNVISVTIEDPKACPRFMAALMTGITVNDSPLWLQQRLRALGQRPINNIVDATNYVMYAIGQPLHAYDADLFPQVDGVRQFAVRFARPLEEVSLIPEGGKQEDRIVTCNGTELLIVDASTDTPIGLAGVKGGRYAGVHAGTTNIIIEAAHFHPTITRRTARRLGIVIDASKRFENEPSRELPPYALRDIITLIADIAGGQSEGVCDIYVEPTAPVPVELTTAKTNALLGLTLTTKDIAAIMERIGATITQEQETTLTVIGPWERSDLMLEEDFIEEVGRIYGLAKITSVAPVQISVQEINLRQYYTELIRQELTAAGFSEVITSSFAKKDTIQLQNSLASDKSYVRSTLTKNLTAVLNQNYSHSDLLGLRSISLFEIGTVFQKTESGVSDQVMVALGVRTKGDGYSAKDDVPLKTACDTVDYALGTPLRWSIKQGVAEANISEIFTKLPVPEQYAPLSQKVPTTYQRVSAYPAVARDIALWVSTTESPRVVEATLLTAAGAECVRIDLFDTFSNEGRTSLAFRLVFQSFTKTLTDEEVNQTMEEVYLLARQNGWEVR